MTDLTDFLAARYVEDEAVARAAIASSFLAEGQWLARGQDIGGAQCYVISEGREDVTGQEATLTAQAAEHIARHDPARVLAECEAKRRIVELHGDQVTPEGRPYFSHEIRLLALPYADHPDYREEWRP